MRRWKPKMSLFAKCIWRVQSYPLKAAHGNLQFCRSQMAGRISVRMKRSTAGSCLPKRRMSRGERRYNTYIFKATMWGDFWLWISSKGNRTLFQYQHLFCACTSPSLQPSADSSLSTNAGFSQEFKMRRIRQSMIPPTVTEHTCHGFRLISGLFVLVIRTQFISEIHRSETKNIKNVTTITPRKQTHFLFSTTRLIRTEKKERNRENNSVVECVCTGVCVRLCLLCMWVSKVSTESRQLIMWTAWSVQVLDESLGSQHAKRQPKSQGRLQCLNH